MRWLENEAQYERIMRRQRKTRKTAQLVKCLLCKHEALCSDLHVQS